MQRAKDAGALRTGFDPADFPMLLRMLTAVVDAHGGWRIDQSFGALNPKTVC